MGSLSERLLDFLISKATKPAWLAVLWILATLVIGYAIVVSGVSLALEGTLAAAALGGSAVTLIALAYALPPKVAKDKVGISFAIATEGEPEANKVQFDLVRAVKRALEERPTAIPFQVHVIASRHFPDGLGKTEAEVLLRKSRTRFLLYGDLRKRKSAARDVYSLRFAGMITHAPTSQENSQMLAAEMTSVLPLKLDIDCNADLEGFEMTSEQIANGAKYIVAIAYFLSNATREAIQLLQSLQQAASVIARNPLPLSHQLSGLVERRLCDFQLHRASVLHFEWRHSHQTELIAEAEQIVLTLPERSRQRLDVRNFLAICGFVTREDVQLAQTTFNDLSRAQPKNPSWMYSLAFLAAFNGDLEAAHRLYKKAFQHDDSSALSIEIEEFVAWAAENHPDRPQLFYCLGYINGRHKRDAQRAISDFERFVELADPSRYARRIELARKYVQRLQRGEWINS